MIDKQKENRQVVFIVNLIISFFTETFVGIALGYFIGRFLDNLLFEDKTILAYVLLFLGLFGGLSNLIKRALNHAKKGDEQNEKS